MGAAEPRYARALYALQLKTGADGIKKSAECLDAVAEAFTEIKEVNRFMHNPLIPAAARKNAALNLLPDGAPKNLKSLLALLADRKRLPLLPGIAGAYRKLLTDAGDVLYIKVSSAYPLESEQLKSIGEIFTKRYKAKAFTVTGAEDKSLLGGVRVQIGDKVYDGTLKMKLVRLKESMR